MATITPIDTIFFLIAFFVPGYMINITRAQFIIERKHGTSQEFILKVLGYSILNYALLSAVIYYILASNNSSIVNALLWFCVLFIFPLIIGVSLGLLSQKEWGYRFFRKFGFSPVHITPSAWDWKFSRMSGSYVLVILKDGTKYAGWCADQSFMSSDPKERDMYIEKMYDIPDDGSPWKDRGNGSVLICANEIRTIEFITSIDKEKKS